MVSNDDFKYHPNIASDSLVIKKNQVLPAVGSLTRINSLSFRDVKQWISFWDAFRMFGPVLVAIVLISISWTTWLVVLAIAPNATANYLMNTAEFEDGQFWLMVDPEYSLKVLSIVGLVIVDLCYLLILFKLVSCRYGITKQSGQWSGKLKVLHALYSRIVAYWDDIGGVRGKYRKFWNLLQKTGDLTMQSIMLSQLLQDGSAKMLVLCYAIFLCVNALSVATTILFGQQSALHEILVDSFFDLIAAVIYPMLVLLYSANNFHFDRKLFSVNIEILPPGSFENRAWLFVDPSERALFSTSLDSLRILSYSDLVLRLSMNFSFCVRFVTVLNLMIETSRKQKTRKSTWETLAEIFRLQRRVPRPVAGIFIAFGAAVIAYTHGAVTSSQTACARHPECVVYAYHWKAGEICPCRTIVDIYRTPQTYDEWMNPVNVFEKVKALAAAGKLQNLQLVNRALPAWPDELQKCKGLQYLSMIYTETETFPDWAKEWTNLQFLHIQGKQLRPSLVHLPDDLFRNMPSLQMIHIGMHPKLLRLPALNGVPNLRSLTLASQHLVRELPLLDKVPKLQHIVMPYMESLQVIPDLGKLQNLVEFVIAGICPVCCNGFKGTCDPTDWFCAGNSVFDVPPSPCLDANVSRRTPVTQQVFERFNATLCIRSGFDKAKVVDILSQAQIDVCGGVPYRRCEFPPNSGKFGICMNFRLQALMCVVNDDYVRLRKVQIQRKVGPPCDIGEEAWLGCGAVS